MMTKQSITSGQKKQYKRFVEDAANRALKEVGLDKDGIQQLISRGGEFQAGIVASIRKHSVLNQFANEEVKSNYTYPPEYDGPKPIKEQIKAIAKIFDLDPASALEYAKSLPELPDHAEGWFAIPSVDALAEKHFSEVTDPAERYCRAVQLVLKKIAASRSSHNYRGGQITSDHLRVHARTARALASIAETQKGDIWIVAAQLGMRHRGRSTRRAREVFVAGEFGLNSLAGSIILTHPERLVRWEQLHIDCAGDEFAPPDAGGDFSHAPMFFDFYGGVVGFGAGSVGAAFSRFGSASGFSLPQN